MNPLTCSFTTAARIVNELLNEEAAMVPLVKS